MRAGQCDETFRDGTKQALVRTVSVAELIEELRAGKIRSATEPGRTLVGESFDVLRDGKNN